MLYIIYRTRQLARCPYLLYGYDEDTRDITGAGMAGMIFFIIIAAVYLFLSGNKPVPLYINFIISALVIFPTIQVSESDWVKVRLGKFNSWSNRRKIITDLLLLALVVISVIKILSQLS